MSNQPDRCHCAHVLWRVGEHDDTFVYWCHCCGSLYEYETGCDDVEISIPTMIKIMPAEEFESLRTKILEVVTNKNT